MHLRDLVGQWNEQAKLLQDHGALEAAATKLRDAQELERTLTQYELEQLSPKAAAIESGYSAAQIRRLFPGLKRIPRRDLPKKPGRAA